MILDLFRNEVEFKNIQWYDDMKDIVKRALDAEDNYNLLFIGPPASAKTLFLLGILESRKGVYFDGSLDENFEKECQSYGLNWLRTDYFEFHKSTEIDFDNWKKGFPVDLPFIKARGS